MTRVISLFIIFLGLITPVFCQKKQIEALQVQLRTDNDDTIKIGHLNQLAKLYMNQGKYKEAEKQIKTSLNLSERIGSIEYLNLTHNLTLDLYNQWNKPEVALVHFRTYLSVRDSLENEQRKTSEIEEKKKNHQISITEEASSTKLNLLISVMVIFLFSSIYLLVRLSINRSKYKKLNQAIAPMLSAKAELDKMNSEMNNLSELQKTHSAEAEKLRKENSILFKKANELEALNIKQEAYLEKYRPIIKVDELLVSKEQELIEIKSNIENYQKKQSELKHEVDLLEESLENIDYGFYKPHFTFSTTSEFKIELEKVNDAQKEMIKNEEATISKVEWTVGDSKAEGRKMIKQYSKLMLRAFNGDADAAIAKVSWNNIITMEARISKSFDSINVFGSAMQISISEKYKDLKLKELHLNFELDEKLYKEREEQRKIKEQMKEEEKAQRELERNKREAEEEEARYEKALQKAKQEADDAKGKELDELNVKIRTLEEKLQNAHMNKERAISRAQMTRSGYVYIISNIGSFGEHVYKIGMTRRLDPKDRVNELGDASVPFDFDIHGLIYSEDAPGLEATLHARFEYKRVNLVNYRTEFFNVTIDEIEDVVKDMQLQVELTKIAEAKEYRESVSLVKAKPLDI